MVEERTTIHSYQRVPTAAEVLRDIMIAVMGRSAEYNPAVANRGNVRSRMVG